MLNNGFHRQVQAYIGQRLTTYCPQYDVVYYSRGELAPYSYSRQIRLCIKTIIKHNSLSENNFHFLTNLYDISDLVDNIQVHTYIFPGIISVAGIRILNS